MTWGWVNNEKIFLLHQPALNPCLSFYPVTWRMCSLNKMIRMCFSKLLVLFPPSKTSSTFDIRRWWRGSPNTWAGWDVWYEGASAVIMHHTIQFFRVSCLFSSHLFCPLMFLIRLFSSHYPPVPTALFTPRCFKVSWRICLYFRSLSVQRRTPAKDCRRDIR